MKQVRVSGSLILFCALSAVFLCGCPSREVYRDKRVMMGTFVEVVSCHSEAAEIVFKEIKRIAGLLSKYDPQSEISRLNAAGSLKVSPETYFILEKAQEFWINSGQAFDVTVGPLLDLWGFTRRDYRLPSPAEVEKALECVGMGKIIFNRQERRVEFSHPGMRLDLGAIAKGYAVDCAVEKLRQAKISSCLINAGGDIYCLGTKFNQPWKVAIQDPRRKSGQEGYLFLQDRAVATSGGYEQFFENENRRYSHIFNPRTGYPAESSVVSVTVTANDCLTADALATSLFVLGKIKGKVLLEHYPQAKCERIDERGD